MRRSELSLLMRFVLFQRGSPAMKRSVLGLLSSVAVLMCTVCVVPVAGQSVWILTAPANPDHTTIFQTVPVVDHYELVLTRQGGSTLPAHNLGKPALTPSCQLGGSTVLNCIQVSVDAYLISLPPGTYSGILWVVGPGGQAVSPASGLFCLGQTRTAADFTVSHQVTAVTPTAVDVEVTVTDCVGAIRTALLSFPLR